VRTDTTPRGTRLAVALAVTGAVAVMLAGIGVIASTVTHLTGGRPFGHMSMLGLALGGTAILLAAAILLAVALSRSRRTSRARRYGPSSGAGARPVGRRNPADPYLLLR